MFDRVSNKGSTEMTDNELNKVSGGLTPLQFMTNDLTTNKQTTAQKAADQADALVRS